MCAQFMIRAKKKKVEMTYGARIEESDLWTRFKEIHIFPRYFAPVVATDGRGGRVVRPMQFALIPEWERGEKPKRVFHNARSETIHQKPAFQDAFRSRRCLIPMTDFFEWIYESETKKWLARFYPKEEEEGEEGVLSAAAVWNSWKSPSGEQSFDSFAIVTTEPHPFIRETGHDRMPLFLSTDAYDAWLEPGSKTEKLFDVMKEQQELQFEAAPFELPPRKPRKKK